MSFTRFFRLLLDTLHSSVRDPLLFSSISLTATLSLVQNSSNSFFLISFGCSFKFHWRFFSTFCERIRAAVSGWPQMLVF